MSKKQFNLNLLIVAGIILVIVFLAYLLISAGHMENENVSPEKKIEIENSTLRGYKDGQLLWSMQAQYIWSAMSIDHAMIENIYNGKFYDEDKLLLDQLTARKVQANAPQERFYADKGFRSIMYRNYNPEQPIDVWGEQLNYNAADKKSTLYKKIQVTDRDTKITAERATIDHSNNQIHFGKDAVLSRPDSSLTADELLIDINKDIFSAKKNTKLIRKADDSDDEFKKQDTTIFTDDLQADVSQDLAKFTLSGNILIKQTDKQAVGETARFDEEDNLFQLRGNASVIFDKTETLIDTATRQKLKNKEILQEKLQLQGDSIVINIDTKDLNADGNVQVTVKDKQAVSEKAIYNRRQEEILLYNNVTLKQEDGSIVKAEQVIVDIPTEKFTAIGKAESTLYLKR